MYTVVYFFSGHSVDINAKFLGKYADKCANESNCDLNVNTVLCSLSVTGSRIHVTYHLLFGKFVIGLMLNNFAAKLSKLLHLN